MHHDPISRTAEIVFNDISKEEGEAWARKFVQHSAASFASELTYAGYQSIPVSYLLCEDDWCIPAKNQRQGIEIIEQASGKKVDVKSIKAGHCPTVSQEKVVVDWILEIAKKD
jgi:hypothetical protein